MSRSVGSAMCADGRIASLHARGSMFAVLVLAATQLGTGMAAAEPADQGLSISGGALYKDGQPFVIRGFSMEAAVPPQWCSAYRWGVTARNHHGAGELNPTPPDDDVEELDGRFADPRGDKRRR